MLTSSPHCAAVSASASSTSYVSLTHSLLVRPCSPRRRTARLSRRARAARRTSHSLTSLLVRHAHLVAALRGCLGEREQHVVRLTHSLATSASCSPRRRTARLSRRARAARRTSHSLTHSLLVRHAHLVAALRGCLGEREQHVVRLTHSLATSASCSPRRRTARLSRRARAARRTSHSLTRY